jgi:hypothetical protein
VAYDTEPWRGLEEAERDDSDERKKIGEIREAREWIIRSRLEDLFDELGYSVQWECRLHHDSPGLFLSLGMIITLRLGGYII